MAAHITRVIPRPADHVWRIVTDWKRHGEFVPLTTVSEQGGTISAVTALGPVSFVDPMRIVQWQPVSEDTDGFARLEKQGRVLGGWAEIRVRRTSAESSELDFREEIWPRPDRLGRRLGVVSAPLTALFVRRLVDALTRAAMEERR